MSEEVAWQQRQLVSKCFYLMKQLSRWRRISPRKWFKSKAVQSRHMQIDIFARNLKSIDGKTFLGTSPLLCENETNYSMVNYFQVNCR